MAVLQPPGKLQLQTRETSGRQSCPSSAGQMRLAKHWAVGDRKCKSHARGKCDGEGLTDPFYNLTLFGLEPEL